MMTKPTTTQADNKRITYYTVFKLVADIDANLIRRTRHYRNRNGQLLYTLDQVVQAILIDDLKPQASA